MLEQGQSPASLRLLQQSLAGSWREACCVPRAAFSFGFPTATSHENKLKKQHISLLLLFQASQGQSCRRASRRGDRAGTPWGRGRERGGTLAWRCASMGIKPASSQNLHHPQTQVGCSTFLHEWGDDCRAAFQGAPRGRYFIPFSFKRSQALSHGAKHSSDQHPPPSSQPSTPPGSDVTLRWCWGPVCCCVVGPLGVTALPPRARHQQGNNRLILGPAAREEEISFGSPTLRMLQGQDRFPTRFLSPSLTGLFSASPPREGHTTSLILQPPPSPCSRELIGGAESIALTPGASRDSSQPVPSWLCVQDFSGDAFHGCLTPQDWRPCLSPLVLGIPLRQG